MNRSAIAGAFLSAVGLVTFFSTGHAAGPATRQASQAPTSRPVNKMCPLNPDTKIDPTVTYVYKGKVYGFCCSDCIADFKKDPEKYIANLK
jgi:YHS domain-containing protein